MTRHMRGLAILLLFAASLCYASSVSHLVSAVLSGDTAAYSSVVVPLSQAVKLTYTWKTEEVVPGWSILPLEHNPAGGVHSLAFQSSVDANLVLVAFRGTDLDTSTVSGQADACANALMSGSGKTYPFCDKFSPEDLDYLGQSQAFVSLVQAQHPKASLLFSGHSLGAALAEAMQLTQLKAKNNNTAAIVFSAPGVAGLAGRAGLLGDRPSQEGDRIIDIANTYDPVVRMRYSEQIGAQCLYSDGVVESTDCKICLANVTLDSAPCMACFMQTHYYRALLDLIETSARPQCVVVKVPRTIVTEERGSPAVPTTAASTPALILSIVAAVVSVVLVAVVVLLLRR